MMMMLSAAVRLMTPAVQHKRSFPLDFRARQKFMHAVQNLCILRLVRNNWMHFSVVCHLHSICTGVSADLDSKVVSKLAPSQRCSVNFVLESLSFVTHLQSHVNCP
jgi:hypothetical protein